MIFSVSHKGDGFAEMRVRFPDYMLTTFMQFIESQKYIEKNRTPSIKINKSVINEKYFNELNDRIRSYYLDAISSGSTRNAAVSETLLKMKGACFHNVSYDIVKSILSKQGLLRPKKS